MTAASVARADAAAASRARRAASSRAAASRRAASARAMESARAAAARARASAALLSGAGAAAGAGAGGGGFVAGGERKRGDDDAAVRSEDAGHGFLFGDRVAVRSGRAGVERRVGACSKSMVVTVGARSSASRSARTPPESAWASRSESRSIACSSAEVGGVGAWRRRRRPFGVIVMCAMRRSAARLAAWRRAPRARGERSRSRSCSAASGLVRRGRSPRGSGADASCCRRNSCALVTPVLRSTARAEWLRAETSVRMRCKRLGAQTEAGFACVWSCGGAWAYALTSKLYDLMR